MALRAISYASEAVTPLEAPRLVALVDDAARFNQGVDVTGVLLFDGQRFLQYIEGPERALMEVYARILASGSHSEIIELARGRVGRRVFPDWSMRLLPISAEMLSDAARADWSGFVRRASRGGDMWAAMDHLAAAARAPAGTP